MASTAIALLVVGTLLVAIATGAPTSDENDHMVFVREVHSKLSRRDQSELPEFLTTEFDVNGKTVTFKLRKNRNVNVNAPMHFVGGGKDVKVRELKDVGLYQDLERGAALSIRVLNEENGLVRTLEGSFDMGQHRYAIEPESRALNDVAELLERRAFGEEAENIGRLHRVYKIQLNINSKHGDMKRDHDDFVNLYDEFSQTASKKSKHSPRQKRAASTYLSYHVELGFALDHTVWEYFLDKASGDETEATAQLKYFYSHILNGIDLAYKTIDINSFGYEITPFLKYYIIGKTKADSPWTVDSITSTGATYEETAVDGDQILEKLGDLASGKMAGYESFSWSNPDHIMGFTKYDLFGDSTSGYAWVAGVCVNKAGVSINECNDFHCWGTASHELGHNLGARHDGNENSCSESNKNIMYPGGGLLTQADLPNTYKFSDCSASYFKETLAGTEDPDSVQCQSRLCSYPRVCLYNQVCYHDEPLLYIDLLPGELYSLDDQCKIHFGDSASSCKDWGADNCYKLGCERVYDNQLACWSGSPRGAEGTACGDEMWCRGGQCVSKVDYPAPVPISVAGCTGTGLDTTVPDGCTDDPTATSLDCDDIVATTPQWCFIWETAKVKCCATCHKAGLWDSNEHELGGDTAVNGGWGDWTTYSTCSATCGSGTQTRSRFCNNPSPANGGSDCQGDATQSTSCGEDPCPVAGGWTEWSNWGSCSVSCGSGERERSRECTNPAPAAGGTDCEGAPDDTEACVEGGCPVDGGWGGWANWGACSVTCGEGTQERSRSCDSPAPANNGQDCSGAESDNRACQAVDCPVNGGWGDWSGWTTCSVTCGSGTETRTRHCDNPAPANNGDDCSDSGTDTRDCTGQDCPVDGAWSDWSDWSDCSQTCGTGVESRTRQCDSPAPQHNGMQCQGDASDERSCTELDNCPIDGDWSEWTSWGQCSVTCGDGKETRVRACNNPSPEFGGKQCVGDEEESQFCTSQSCPVDGEWGGWSGWTACSKSCGTGSRTRNRVCDSPAASGGGLDCVGHDEETEACNEQSCPVEGGWGDWSGWGSCSATCGDSWRTRTRLCNNPAPSNGGSQCTGVSQHEEACTTENCVFTEVFTTVSTTQSPVDGGWGDWSGWGSCSATCGDSWRTRTRLCNNPAPSNGGSQCTGVSQHEEACTTENCVFTEVFTTVSTTFPTTHSTGCGDDWGVELCSQFLDLCNSGIIDVECAKSCGTCNNGDSGWSTWSAWSGCSVTCGTGTESRYRTCFRDFCQGHSEEYQECTKQACGSGECVDLYDVLCVDWASSGDCTDPTWEQQMFEDCPMTCGYCGGCEDNNDNCEDWADAGDCNNPVFSQQMEADCPAACGWCSGQGGQVDGEWGGWSGWTACSKSCGTGSRTRNRVCDSPAASGGGLDCVGPDEETEACNEQSCPETCEDKVTSGSHSCDERASNYGCYRPNTAKQMAEDCPKRCKLCPGDCKNYRTSCDWWASLGRCTSKKKKKKGETWEYYMNKRCPMACGRCW